MKTLETKRLILRNFKETDLNDFYEYAKVDGVGEMAGWPHHSNIEITKLILDSFINKDDVYAIVWKENNKVIGSLGLHDKSNNIIQREIGYVLSKDYWGNGIMSEAVKAVIKYSFEDLNVEMLWCGHFIFNDRSRRVVEKCGFKFHSQNKYIAKQLNAIYDEYKYNITKADYEKLNNS